MTSSVVSNRLLALRVAKTLLSCLVGTWASVASAFDLDPGEIRGKSSKEPVTVLQNRAFIKAFRPEAGLLAGSILNEAYLNTQIFGARAGLFLTEWVGVETQMIRTRVSASQDRKALDGMKFRPLDDSQSSNALPNGSNEVVTVSPEPEVNAIRGITDFNAVAAPFYGKLNLLNKWIVYTDLCLTGGISRLETDQGDKTGMVLGIGERFYIGQEWSIRFDYRDRIFTEERAGNRSRRNAYSIDLGTSYFLN